MEFLNVGPAAEITLWILKLGNHANCNVMITTANLARFPILLSVMNVRKDLL